MILSPLHKSAITNALKQGLSFAIFRDKGCVQPQFICDAPHSYPLRSEKRFFAVNWLGKFADRLEINDRFSPEQAAEFISSEEYKLAEPWAISTDNSDYNASVNMLIDELNLSGGKTVISRVIFLPLQNSITDITERYFEINSEAYCCLLHTPQTGCWLIASPELLLSADLTTNQIRTVALAGTRESESTDNTQWDNKNIDEQNIVKNYIEQVFTDMNIQFDEIENVTVKANNVEHIATYFKGKIADNNAIEQVIDVLNPTPALCGMPRDISINRIRSIEQHPRRLYGGYFGFIDENIFKAIVTLRCAQLSESKACIYAGGGITANSLAQAEWHETSLKSQGLTNILMNIPNE